MVTESLPQSMHFQLESIAEGVYAAIAVEGSGAAANAGIIDLGGHVLVFDTFLSPLAALDLRSAASQLAPDARLSLINSHWHADHIRGNQVFPRASPVISTDRTRTLIDTLGREALDRFRPQAVPYLASLEVKLAEATDDSRRAHLERAVASVRQMVEFLPKLSLRLPSLTFERRLTLFGSRRCAELLCYGGGHTASDAFLYLPEERIVFAGDLVAIDNHPWMGHGDPEEWLQNLDRIARLDIQLIVPGHGPLGGRAAIQRVARYITDLLRLAASLTTRGASGEQAAQTSVPAAYGAWGAAEIFERNLQFLADRAKERSR